MERRKFSKIKNRRGFLISAKREDGKIREVKIEAKEGGTIKLANPFEDALFTCSNKYKIENRVITIVIEKGKTAIINKD